MRFRLFVSIRNPIPFHSIRLQLQMHPIECITCNLDWNTRPTANKSYFRCWLRNAHVHLRHIKKASGYGSNAYSHCPLPKLQSVTVQIAFMQTFWVSFGMEIVWIHGLTAEPQHAQLSISRIDWRRFCIQCVLISLLVLWNAWQVLQILSTTKKCHTFDSNFLIW